MQRTNFPMEQLRAFLGLEKQRISLFLIGVVEVLIGISSLAFLSGTPLGIIGGLSMCIAVSGVYNLVRGFRYPHYQKQITLAIDRIADTAGMDTLLTDFMGSITIDESIRVGKQYIYLAKNRLILSAGEIQRAGVRYDSDAESSSTNLELNLCIKEKPSSIIVGIGPKRMIYFQLLTDKRYHEVADAINCWLAER